MFTWRIQKSLICQSFKSPLLLAPILMLLAPTLSSAFDWTSWFRRGDQQQKFQNWLDEGRTLRARRLTDPALENFNRILDLDPWHEEATFEIAETYFQSHRWAEAVDWFYALSFIDPQQRLAFSRRWTAALELSGSDTLLQKAARLTIRQEIASFLRQYPWDWETLFTAREGAQVIEDSLLVAELTERLLFNYPNTAGGYSIISEKFYAGFYAAGNDAARRTEFIQDFLTTYPVTDFRETAWQYLVSAFRERADTLNLRKTLSRWLADDPENPLPYERTVRHLLDLGVPGDSLLPLARQAIDLARQWRGKPLKPLEQRLLETKHLYAGTRLNIARILMELGRRTEARLWLEDGRKHCGYGVDDEGTFAPFYYYLGVIAEREYNESEAMDYYVQVLREGDVRGDWTARADSALERLLPKHAGSAATDKFAFARQRAQYRGPLFDEVTELQGLKEVKGGRVAWGDANGDGYDDLLVDGSQLFINHLGHSFQNVTDSCGIRREGVTGGVWADVDLDGDLDIFCAANGSVATGRDRLYLNQWIDLNGTPHFREATEFAAVLSDTFPTEGAAWGDLQGDGRPDLYLANYELPGTELSQGTPDFLFVNRLHSPSSTSLEFQKLGPDSGLRPPFNQNHCGRGVNWGDFDGDGDQDLYVANYRLQENYLWVNSGGQALENLACFYGVAGEEKQGWWGHTIGAEWGDFDNDGDLDLITANLAHPRYIEFSNRTCLYENRLRQDGTFKDVRRAWGLKYEETHSDPAWGDVDADGDLDLYITSIYPQRRSFLYLNDLGERRFRDVTYLAGVRVTNAWGCAYSDFDNDGDLDLVVGSSDGVHLFRNRGVSHHWLEVELPAAGSAYGTRLEITRQDQILLREIQGGKGTTSQHSRVAYFGLGSNPQPVTLDIRWPSGKRLKLKKVLPDQKLILKDYDVASGP